MQVTDWLWAIPVFGLLIFIHELGHFAVAKYFDVRVHEFALGFGPMVAGFERGETRYSLRLIPLGGFVRMAGMEESDSEDPRGFNRKSLWARSLTIAAGPVMNFVLAALLYSAYLHFVGTVQTEPILGDVPIECPTSAGATTGTVQVACPAHAAGLRKGDRILSIDGKPMQSWQETVEAVKTSTGMPLHFRIQRGPEQLELRIRPIYIEGRWMVGIQPSVRPEPLGSALVKGPVMTARFSLMWVEGLLAMLTGRVEPQVAGPVGITREIAEQASRGWDSLLLLTAFLSINLGMFNLLPIPALDGSRLVFMLVELVRGRRVDPQRENMVHFVGFLILIGLMIVITYSEVARR